MFRMPDIHDLEGLQSGRRAPPDATREDADAGLELHLSLVTIVIVAARAIKVLRA